MLVNLFKCEELKHQRIQGGPSGSHCNTAPNINGFPHKPRVTKEGFFNLMYFLPGPAEPEEPWLNDQAYTSKLPQKMIDTANCVPFMNLTFLVLTVFLMQPWWMWSSFITKVLKWFLVWPLPYRPVYHERPFQGLIM